MSNVIMTGGKPARNGKLSLLSSPTSLGYLDCQPPNHGTGHLTRVRKRDRFFPTTVKLDIYVPLGTLRPLSS